MLISQIRNNFSPRNLLEKKVKIFKGIELFTWLKYLKSSKNHTFSTLGHHHPDDDLVSKIFGFYLFNMLAHFKPKQTLWTAFLDQFLPKNNKKWIFQFTFHSKRLKVLAYSPQLFFKISGGERRGRWRTWEQRYTELFKIQSPTLHRKDNNSYTCANSKL